MLQSRGGGIELEAGEELLGRYSHGRSRSGPETSTNNSSLGPREEQYVKRGQLQDRGQGLRERERERNLLFQFPGSIRSNENPITTLQYNLREAEILFREKTESCSQHSISKGRHS